MKTDIEKILDALEVEREHSFGWLAVLPNGRYFEANIPNDLNAIRELELLVIEKVGVYEYGDKLFENVVGLFDFSDTQRAALFATADAPTRIAAMIAALEDK